MDILTGENNVNPSTRTLTSIKSNINNDLNLDNSLRPESEKFSFFSYIMKVVRYILVIYLVAYIILTILNQLDLLPLWLKDLFSPFDLVERIYYNKDNNTKKDRDNKKDKDNKKDQQLATSIQKENLDLNTFHQHLYHKKIIHYRNQICQQAQHNQVK